MSGLEVHGPATEAEIAAVVVALRARPEEPAPLRDWRRARRQALRMQRGT
ncbi:hypothetical protein LWF15_29710 [Kineosporia rhizophila]|nr:MULTISPECIES: hypothetical protein [Kineosporia]MCE0539683.1 hypothetical protein [Kineosporia rhizophila]GLY16423.1 hypothetical protein Kisp01_34380 [Kineosporia sp. NBRC 101677]